MTTIALLLNEGSGTIFANADRTSDRAPIMVGYVEFTQNKEKNQKLKLDVAVWLKQKTNSEEKFYSLSIGGINASLFKESEKVGDGPDYAGSFGFNHEMRIAGWKKPGVNGAKDYISLSITPKIKSASQPDSQQTPASTQAASQGQANQQGQGHDDQSTPLVQTGTPGFVF
ncbi:hypothetical protein [Pseudomonas sp. PS02290]|uniref:hypothetical protein n=1 Tax=Pseudomonas sp. PS02290 TaxID=2991430 RepID=UPI001A122A3D|nr:hypothetical protein [Pseudomonas sp. PS02290]MBF9243144.1 hypothetical protein [Pseudomonas syringae pv. tomato]